MSQHPFDAAVALQPQANGSWQGHTSPAYANMVGPFGGTTAAQAIQAVLLHPQRVGEPVSLTVNFVAPVADGAFTIHTRIARTNRSTQHWVIEMAQEGQTVLTATTLTALRRETWGANDAPMPSCPAPDTLAVPQRLPLNMAFLNQYELRAITGTIPHTWDGSGTSSLTQLWVRDQPPRALDFASLTALSDIFFPRIFARRATLVPVGTVSMTVYFHASSAELQRAGTEHLLGQAHAHTFRHGFFDQTAHLWSQAGDLLVSTHQIVYYKA